MISVRRKARNFFAVIIVIAVCAVVFTKTILPKVKQYQFGETDKNVSSISYSTSSNGPGNSSQEDWKLVLVNKDHPIDKNINIKLKTMPGGESIDERMYPYLQKMFDAAEDNGLYAHVTSGFRTEKDQKQIYDEKVEAFIHDGLTKKEALNEVKYWVADPGTSEHELGLAADIGADKSKCDSDDLYAWLAKNAHKYGFILRYPKDKTDITGIAYEPWHFRYVGEEVATTIYHQGICLEEYLNSLSR